MKVKFKSLTGRARDPQQANPGDAGADLIATSKEENNMYIEYGTDLALEIPHGFVGLLFPRSSISKYHLCMANSVGVIDSGYRGEIKVRFKKTEEDWRCKYYETGDKVAQLVIIPYPSIEYTEVEQLDETERGAGGFGSSGR